MRQLALVLLLLATALGWSQEVKLRVMVRGSEVGTARCVQGLLSDGGKQVTISMDIRQGGRQVRIRSEAVYAKDGKPIRKIQETSGSDGKVLTKSVATFTAEGARMIVTASGQTKESLVPLDAKLPRAATSEFWFIRDKPKPGATADYYSFSMTEARWVLRKTRYVDQQEVQLGGRKMRGHVIQDDGGTVISDERGMPLVIEMGDLRMERVP